MPVFCACAHCVCVCVCTRVCVCVCVCVCVTYHEPYPLNHQLVDLGVRTAHTHTHTWTHRRQLSDVCWPACDCEPVHDALRGRTAGIRLFGADTCVLWQVCVCVTTHCLMNSFHMASYAMSIRSLSCRHLASSGTTTSSPASTAHTHTCKHTHAHACLCVSAAVCCTQSALRAACVLCTHGFYSLQSLHEVA